MPLMLRAGVARACVFLGLWPFRIFGNAYYVGTRGLSSILVTSPAGHVLIDGALAESVEQIRDHIRAGFRMEDVRLIAHPELACSFRSCGRDRIEAHLTPGHTPGGTSWTWKSCEGERCLNLVYADSLNPISVPDFKFTAHPDVVKGFEQSFAFFRKHPCDILLMVHPDIRDLWNRLERRQQGVKPDPMVDGSARRNFVDNSRKQLAKRLQSAVSP